MVLVPGNQNHGAWAPILCCLFKMKRFYHDKPGINECAVQKKNSQKLEGHHSYGAGCHNYGEFAFPTIFTSTIPHNDQVDGRQWDLPPSLPYFPSNLPKNFPPSDFYFASPSPRPKSLLQLNTCLRSNR